MTISLQKDIPLAPYTSYKIGGPAQFFLEAESLEQIKQGLKFAQEKNLPYFILGQGSNILVADQGYSGLIIKLQPSEKLEITKDNLVKARAGMLLAKLVSETVKKGLQGLEWAAGIPGSVGGAIYGNAGAFGRAIADTILEVKTFDLRTQRVKTYSQKACQFAYRESLFKKQSLLPEVILEAIFKLSPGNPAELKRKVKQILYWRRERQPSLPSGGSVFKNIKDRSFIKAFLEEDLAARELYTHRWQDCIPAAYLIDRAGLRGFRVGRASLAPEHSNFIVNLGGASADEVMILISLIKDRVHRLFGVVLEEEVVLVGF